jgi:hypothetical protein
MMKLIVLLCFISSGQCAWMPWTDNPNGPQVGVAVSYGTKADCETAGRRLLESHLGHYANRPPGGYDIRQYRCGPA